MSIIIRTNLIKKLGKNICGITLFPFIFLVKDLNGSDEMITNHEKIHLRQQLELLIIPFYIIYLIEYLYLRYKKKMSSDNAYHAISFEKESYKNGPNINYLKQRKIFAQWRVN